MVKPLYSTGALGLSAPAAGAPAPNSVFQNDMARSPSSGNISHSVADLAAFGRRARRHDGAANLTPAPPRPLQRARERAAVDHEILVGDEAGMRRAQESAGGAELGRLANASRRNRGDTRRHFIVVTDAL